MIRIHLDEVTLARTRIAVSRLHELIRGVQLLHRHPVTAPWPYTEWAVKARAALRNTPETEPLRLYGQLYGSDHGRRTPDVFTPVPQGASASLDEELTLLRGTPPALVREQFATHYPEGIPEFLQPYARDPERELGRLADAFAVFWELAMAAHWPAMRTALDEEVLLRARSLAADGPNALLRDLHGPELWQPPVLSLPKRKESTLIAADQRLLLVPLIFAEGKLACSTDHPEILMIGYQARGQGLLAAGPAASRNGGRPEDGNGGRAGEQGGDRLAALIGPGLSTLLRALAQPASTTGLATALGLAPSTVSEQLAALQAAGVVHRRRSGRLVLYGLEPTGVALLSLLD